MSGCGDNIDFLKTLFNTWLNEKIQKGEVQAGLLDCENRRIGQWAQVMLCCPGCGNGNGGNTVDKYLVAPIVINKAAKTMTFKVQNGDDVVVDVSEFLAVAGAHEFNLDNTEIVFDTTQGTANKIVLKYKEVVNGEEQTKSIDLPIIGILSVAPSDDNLSLEWVEAGKDGVALAKKKWTAPRTVIEQPTFDDGRRELTIPVKNYVNGEESGSSDLKVTIPAGSAGNGPINITPPGGGQSPKPVYYFHDAAVRNNQSGDAISPTSAFDKVSSVHVDTFYNSQGQVKTNNWLTANPSYPSAQWTVSAPAGVTAVTLMNNVYDLATGRTEIYSANQLPFAKLETPEVDSQGRLIVKLAHYTQDGKVANSDQQVTVALPASKAAITQSGPRTSRETNLPLSMYGKDRSAIMGEPHAWEEVTGSDGQVYLRPLYRRG